MASTIRKDDGAPVCYFSYIPHSSSHFSIETPLFGPDSLGSVEALHSGHAVADPYNPLLACRNDTMSPSTSSSSTVSAMDASRLLQLQTSVAHTQQSSSTSSSRPQASPLQHHTTSVTAPALMTTAGCTTPNFSAPSTTTTYFGLPSSSLPIGSSASSRGSISSIYSFEAADTLVRCSRCHRSNSLGNGNPTAGMISYGTNLFYCRHCASIVGYDR